MATISMGNIGSPLAGVVGVQQWDGNQSIPTMGAMADFNFSSANAAGTNAQSGVAGLDCFRSALIYAELTGATGGTLDIYLQVSPDGGTTWVDYAHFPQIAAGAAVVKKVWQISKRYPLTTLTTVGQGSSPALAANTILGGEFTDRMRVIAVSGGGTTLGAAQVIKAFFSP